MRLGCPDAFRPNMPWGHGMHDAAPDAEYVPSRQGSHAVVALTLVLNRPAAHSLH